MYEGWLGIGRLYGRRAGVYQKRRRRGSGGIADLRDDDGLDVRVGEHVVVAAPLCRRVVAVPVDFLGEVFCQFGGGGEAARVDGFEREVWRREDGGLAVRVSMWCELQWWVPRARRTRCSSFAKMPLPTSATPTDIFLSVRWEGIAAEVGIKLRPCQYYAKG